ncbi:protein disulfide-isomerase precursor [Coemansia sp. BCRC 34301]|nr:protein disulfide-isomerase precursor [Coemansia sp. BCRC 34301]
MAVASLRRIAWSMTAALAAAGLCFAETKETAVHVLDNKTFKTWSAAQSLALVEFYAPWCSYCKAMAPAYEMAATTLQKDKIPLAKVDCAVEKSLCNDMDIHGYPTLKVLKHGLFYPYNGTRQESSMVTYMRKHNSPSVTEVSPAEFGPFVKSEHVVVMGFFDTDSPALKVLEDVANDFRDEYGFGYTSNKATAKKLGLTPPSIVVYKDFDERWDAFKGSFAAADIRMFVRARSIPLLGQLSPQTFRTYAKAGFPIGAIFYEGEQSRKELEAMILPLAKEFRGVVSFAMVDAAFYTRHALLLNLKAQWPAFAIQDIAAQTKYPLDQSKDLSAEQIRNHVQSFASGGLEPSYKSEPIPKDNSGNVFELVSKQFVQIAFDTAKDVLIEFYSPHCIYCKQLAPVYDELGKSLKHNADLLVAKMDGSLNDIPSSDPELNIPGYPTIVLVRAGDNKIIKYDGDRSLESFAEFVRVNSAHPVSHAPANVERIHVQDQAIGKGFTPKDTHDSHVAAEFNCLVGLQKREALEKARTHATEDMKDLAEEEENREQAERACALRLQNAKDALKAGRAEWQKRMDEEVDKLKATYEGVVESISHELQERNRAVETKTKTAEVSRGTVRAMAEELGVTADLWAQVNSGATPEAKGREK